MRKIYWITGILATFGSAAAVSFSMAQTVPANPAYPVTSAPPSTGRAKSVIPPPGPLPSGTLDLVSGMPAAIDKKRKVGGVVGHAVRPFAGVTRL